MSVASTNVVSVKPPLFLQGRAKKKKKREHDPTWCRLLSVRRGNQIAICGCSIDGNSWDKWAFCRSGLSTNVTADEYGVLPALISTSYCSHRIFAQHVDLSSAIDFRIPAGLDKGRRQHIINLQRER